MAALEVLGAVGSLASIVSFGLQIRSEREQGREIRIEPTFILEAAEGGGAKLQSNARLVQAIEVVEGDPVFEAVEERIRLRQKKAAMRISSGEDPANEVDSLIEEICRFLLALRRLKRGHLPRELSKLWNDYGCKKRLKGVI